MAFHRTVLLLALGSFLPHALHTQAPTAAQHLSSLEQRLTKQFSGAQLPVNAATMVKQLHKPLSFFFDLGQQYPTIIPTFDAFLNRLITLTYTRGNAKELSHQREVALTSFVTALAKTLPEHTTNPRVRRVAYQQVREVYNYYANRALTRSVQLGNAPAHVMSREEKMLRWIKTGAIIMAAATAATLIGTAIYQVAKTPAAVSPAPLSRGPQPSPPNPSPTPAPAPAPPFDDDLNNSDTSTAQSALGQMVHGRAVSPGSAPATLGGGEQQQFSAASTMTPPSGQQNAAAASDTPATGHVRRNLETTLAAAVTPHTHSAPAPLADTSSGQRPVLLPPLAGLSHAPAPSPTLSPSPEPVTDITWQPAFESMNVPNALPLLARQYDAMTAEEEALPVVVQLNPTELAPYFTRFGNKKNVKKKLLHAAIHRTLVHDRSIAERKALATRMAATRGQSNRLVVLIPSGTNFSDMGGLTAADVAAVGKEFWTTAENSNLQEQLSGDWRFVDGKIGKVGPEEQAQFRSLFRPQPLPTE